MKILLSVIGVLLWRAGLVNGGTSISERSKGAVLLNENVHFDLTDDMRTKLAGVASRWIHQGADSGTDGGDGNNNRILSLRRSLAVGDFEEFNQLFQHATIQLPDFDVSDRVLGIRLKLQLRELYCEDMSVGDILLTPTKQSNQRLTFKVDLVDLALNCYGRFNYDYGFLDGGGRLEANIDKSTASTVLAFRSSNFQLEPPEESTVESCGAAINIYNMEFRGGIVSRILDAAQRLIGNRIEDEIEGVACDELSSLGSTFVDELLVRAKEELHFYLEPLPASLSDPLVAERNLQVPEGMTLLNFQDTGNTIGAWFNQVLKEVDSLFGNRVDDPGGPNFDERDLSVNVFLRDALLDSDRALSVSLSNLPGDGFDGVLFKSHDKLTETIITLEAVKIYGLDTFRRFEPMNNIGKHTLENEFRWDYLVIEMDVVVDIKPSTLPDSILVNPNKVNIVEAVKISFGVDDLDIVIALLVAIDQDKLGSMHLGSLLDSENIFSCFASVLHEVEVSGLSVSASNIREPSLDGFISPGVDRIVSSAVEAAFLMFEPTLIRAIPSIFQRFVRDILNTEVIDSVLVNPDNLRCPWAGGDTSFIDFRDLFLDPTDAERLGASGEQPYGDVGYLLFDVIQKRFQATEQDGALSINKMIVDPLTKSQSGIEGTLRFPSDLVSLVKDQVSSSVFAPLVDRFELKLSNLRIQNLDSIVAPLSLVEPTFYDGRVVENLFNFDPETERSLDITATLLIALEGNSSLSMLNKIDLSLSIDSLELFTDLYAEITSMRFLQLPVRHILDFDCWLAMVPLIELNENGLIDQDDARTFGLQTFLAKLKGISFGAICLECFSPGTAVLPELLDILEESGATLTLGNRMESLFQSFVTSDSIQSLLDRKVRDAHALCPISPTFNASAVRGDSSIASIPRLTLNAVDTILYAAILAAEVGFIVFAESHRLQPRDVTDLLSGQEKLDVPEVTRLIDWMDVESSVGVLAEAAIERAKSFFGGTKSDGNLRINDVVVDLLGTSGIINLDFDDLSFEVEDFVVALKTARLKGLDSFTRFDVLEAVAPQTLNNLVELDSLRVEVDLRVGFVSANDAPREITLSFEVKEISAEIGLFAAFDLDRLGALELGSLLSIRDILPCILSVAHGINISQLKISMGSFLEPSVDGLMPDTGFAAAASIAAIVERFRPSIEEAIPLIFDHTVREVVNVLLDSYISDSNSACPQREFDSTSRQYIDFRDLILPETDAQARGTSRQMPYGDLFRTLTAVARKQVLKIDPVTGLSAINSVIVGPLTKAQSKVAGSLSFRGDLFNQGTKINVGGLDARIRLRAYNAFMKHIDTFGAPLSLLDTVDEQPNQLNNTASMGVGRPLEVGFRFLFALTGDDNEEIRNDLEISLRMDTVTVVLMAFIKIAEEAFIRFPLRDLPNGQCWLAMMPAPPLDARGVRLEGSESSLSLVHLFASVATLNLNITCVSCTSPGMAELATLLSTPEASEDATEVANDVFGYVTKLLGGEYLQVTFDRMLNDAKRSCPHSADYETSPVAIAYNSFKATESTDQSIQFLIAVAIGIGCLIVFVAVVTVFVRLVVRRRHRKWLRSLLTERVFLLLQQQRAIQGKEANLNATTTSMFLSSQVPFWLRLSMPLIILGNIGLFLSGHLSLAATVNIEATLAGQSFKVGDFFEFSMAFSISEIWNAGGKELAIFILLFSGVWPYTKQLVTLALWFIPPGRVSVSKRGTIFLWLDALAKWSMVDIFVLVITVAGFRVSVQSPDKGFLPPDFYSLDLLVIPMWGLYANLLAQLVSQLSSHCILHFHRRIVQDASDRHDDMIMLRKSTNTFIIDDEEGVGPLPSVDVPNKKKDKLATRSFTRPHRGESDRLVTRRGVNLMLICVALTLSVLVLSGCILPAFAQEVLGIIGVIVESGQEFEQANKNFSLFDVIAMFFEQARFTGRTADFVGLGSLAALLIFSVLIVPIAQAVTLLYLWFRPMTRKTRGRLAVLVEILQAWQYAEVFLLAIIIASWQLGPVSDFMVNDYCDNLEEMFSQLVYYGILDKSDAQCFRVESILEVGAYILASAAVLLVLLNNFVMKAVAQYFRDEDAESELAYALKDNDGDDEYHDDDADFAQAVDKIQPVPVLFTDTFRWFLHREDKVSSFRTTQELHSDDGMLGIDHAFPERLSGDEARDTSSDFLPSGGHDLLADTMVDSGEELPMMSAVEKKDPPHALVIPLLMEMSSDSGSDTGIGSFRGSGSLL